MSRHLLGAADALFFTSPFSPSPLSLFSVPPPGRYRGSAEPTGLEGTVLRIQAEEAERGAKEFE